MINMTLKEFLKKELDDGYFTLDAKLKFVDEFKIGIRGYITLCDAIVEAGNNIKLWDKDIIVPLIDEIDNKYFQSILKPFINKYTVINVEKRVNYDKFFIQINLNKYSESDYIVLPDFNKNTSMFKNLIPNKCYSIEELGITRMKEDGKREFI